MSDEQFQAWFVANLATMTSMGIMHYRAERARDVRAMLEIVWPQFDALEKRIARLEKQTKPTRDERGRFLPHG